MLAVPACHGRSPTATTTVAATSRSPLWASTQVCAVLVSLLRGFLASRGEGILGGMYVCMYVCGGTRVPMEPQLGKVRKSGIRRPCRFGVLRHMEIWGWEERAYLLTSATYGVGLRNQCGLGRGIRYP